MDQFKKITIDISNICNAKCKWCTTGIQNQREIPQANFMTAEYFDKIINYCLNKGIIHDEADIELYSWGEPLLNPQILEILDCISKKGMKYNLSTNASKPVLLKQDHLKTITFLMISLSGFSQESYGRIHGLRLEDIKQNIREMIVPFQEAGMLNKVEINYHVYQFNVGEIEACANFCKDLGIRFVPRYAYFADWQLCNDYLEQKMCSERIYAASKELFLHYYDKLLSEKPADYVCPQMERLFINSKGEVLPCATSTDDVLGNVLEMDFEDIIAAKTGYERCEACMNSGQAYIIQQYTEFLSEYDVSMQSGFRYYGTTMESALYYETDQRSFCEEQKIMCVSNVRKSGHFKAHFRMPHDVMIVRARFDPCEYSCVLSNLFITGDGKRLEYIPYNGEVQEDGSILFETDDPCVVANVNGAVTEVIVEGYIKEKE